MRVLLSSMCEIRLNTGNRWPKGPVSIYHLGWAGRIRNSLYMNFVHPPGLPSIFFEPPPQAT